MQLRDIFEKKIKIEPKVMSIESLFNNQDRVKETNYRPAYQRNYVWDDEKATYFIESILLGTEIPPLVYFRSVNKIEIIDGRQRYETILRFINNNFKLKKNGLHKLNNIGIAGKSFSDLEKKDDENSNLSELFWDTKLRIIEFSFHSLDGISDDIENLVKKEIFKRYNSGITPLRQTEIAKAIYLDNDLNTYFRNKIQDDKLFARDVFNLFHFEKKDIEQILKTIRELLVLHNIPIKYYVIKKQSIISKFYDIKLQDIDENQIDCIFNSFMSKINLLLKLKKEFSRFDIPYNRLVSECFFWMFSILENEDIDLSQIKDDEILNITEFLENYFSKNVNPYLSSRSSFAKELFKRYELTTLYFHDKYKIDFKTYLYNNETFKDQNKDNIKNNSENISFEDLRINKPEPSSIAIVDICRLMQKQKFLIRPPYQRNEVINKKKSSSIIESILLGIKLPPIFILKREDGIYEVLDGQQRLLSILGYIQKPYLNEKNEIVKSNKDGFSLNLKSSILTNLHGKKFCNLSIDEQKKINNFDLWTIEINKKINKNFEPVDLFVRLNFKPYPIKDDTFEMWNSFINREIIDTVKSAYKNNKDWFYVRKSGKRMENENLYASLAYFQYLYEQSINKEEYDYDCISIYRTESKINLRVKSKNEITKIIENDVNRISFIRSINIIEFAFISKVRDLLIESYGDDIGLNKKLDDLLTLEKGKRTQQSMYALWYFLCDIPRSAIINHSKEIKYEVKRLFSKMSNVDSKDSFIADVKDFKKRFKDNYEEIEQYFVKLNSVLAFKNGIKNDEIANNELKENVPLYIDDKSNGLISESNLNEIAVSNIENINKCKILVKINSISDDCLNVLYSYKHVAFKSNYIGINNIRSGVQEKYLVSLLGSKYIYSKLKGKKISQSILKEIEIPIISNDLQMIFSKILDYVLLSESDSLEFIYFKKIIDMMVYEIYMPAVFLKNNLSIINSINKVVPELTLEENSTTDTIHNMYSKISQQNNIISSLYIKILTIHEVMEIEHL